MKIKEETDDLIVLADNPKEFMVITDWVLANWRKFIPQIRSLKKNHLLMKNQI